MIVNLFSGNFLHQFFMLTLLRKLTYLVLTLAIVNTSVQSLYASSHHCDETEMAAQDTNSHCQSQKTKDACSCDNCKCDICITLQANIQSTPQPVSHYLVIADMKVTLILSQYTQRFNNPLLRPPIA